MDILRADRRLRVVAAITLLAIATLGAVSLSLVDAWLAQVERLPPAAGLRQLRSVLVWLAGIGVTLIAPVAYLWYFGSRVRMVRQFPLPGSRVLRDTVVLREEAAARRGKFIQLLAVALALCDAALLFLCWRLYFMLGQ